MERKGLAFKTPSKVEDFWPMPYNEVPPLPRFLGILWPWYKLIWQCPYCGQGFATQQELDEHIASAHPEQPPVMHYQCPYCGAQFVTAEEANAHIASQHPEQPPPVYTCPVCGATFASQDELNAHIAAAHPEVPPAATALSGKVTDSTTGSTIAGVLVTLSWHPEMYGEEITIQTTTDSSGNYSFTNVDALSYDIFFEKEGYERVILAVVLSPGTNRLDVKMASTTGIPEPSRLEYPPTVAPLETFPVTLWIDVGTLSSNKQYEIISLRMRGDIIWLRPDGRYETLHFRQAVGYGTLDWHVYGPASGVQALTGNMQADLHVSVSQYPYPEDAPPLPGVYDIELYTLRVTIVGNAYYTGARTREIIAQIEII